MTNFSLATQYYRSACAVLIVYDISNRKSFEDLERWFSRVEDNAQSNIQRILIGNKCDLTYERNVSKKEGEAFAKEKGIKFIETSAKSDKNVRLAFENLAFDVFLDVENDKIIASPDGSSGVKIGDYLMSGRPFGGGSKEGKEVAIELCKSELDKEGKEEKTCC